MSDRSIAPSPRRMATAWRAGLRPRARWSMTGLSCLVLAATLDLAGPWMARTWAQWLRHGAGGDALLPALSIWGLISIAGLSIALIHALASRSFGAVGPAARDLPGRVRTPVFAIGSVAVVGFTVLAALLAPVLAGAARGVDASDLALAGLWARWAMRLLATTGVLLMVAGVAEHLAMRHGLWRDLHMTRAQAREQSRQPGGR